MEAAWRLATRTVAVPQGTEPFARAIDAARLFEPQGAILWLKRVASQLDNDLSAA
jgi:hypothetical protein